MEDFRELDGEPRAFLEVAGRYLVQLAPVLGAAHGHRQLIQVLSHQLASKIAVAACPIEQFICHRDKFTHQ
jgi:hypothetical protein